MSILAKSEVVCLCNKGNLFRVFNTLLHKLSPNKDDSCCIGKPLPIELKLTFFDFVGHKYSEKSRGARKIDTFGKSKSPYCTRRERERERELARTPHPLRVY